MPRPDLDGRTRWSRHGDVESVFLVPGHDGAQWQRGCGESLKSDDDTEHVMMYVQQGQLPSQADAGSRVQWSPEDEPSGRFSEDATGAFGEDSPDYEYSFARNVVLQKPGSSTGETPLGLATVVPANTVLNTERTWLWTCHQPDAIARDLSDFAVSGMLTAPTGTGVNDHAYHVAEQNRVYTLYEYMPSVALRGGHYQSTATVTDATDALNTPASQTVQQNKLRVMYGMRAFTIFPIGLNIDNTHSPTFNGVNQLQHVQFRQEDAGDPWNPPPPPSAGVDASYDVEDTITNVDYAQTPYYTVTVATGVTVIGIQTTSGISFISLSQQESRRYTMNEFAALINDNLPGTTDVRVESIVPSDSLYTDYLDNRSTSGFLSITMTDQGNTELSDVTLVNGVQQDGGSYGELSTSPNLNFVKNGGSTVSAENVDLVTETTTSFQSSAAKATPAPEPGSLRGAVVMVREGAVATVTHAEKTDNIYNLTIELHEEHDDFNPSALLNAATGDTAPDTYSICICGGGLSVTEVYPTGTDDSIDLTATAYGGALPSVPVAPNAPNAPEDATADVGKIVLVNNQLYYSPAALPEDASDRASLTPYTDTMPQIDSTYSRLFIEYRNDVIQPLKQTEKWRFPYTGNPKDASISEVRVAYSKLDGMVRVAPWIGITWTASGHHALAAPVTKEHGMDSLPYRKYSCIQKHIDVGYTGLKTTLNKATLPELATAIQNAFVNALSGVVDQYKSTFLANGINTDGFYVRSSQDSYGPGRYDNGFGLLEEWMKDHGHNVESRTGVEFAALKNTKVTIVAADGQAGTFTLTITNIPVSVEFMDSGTLNLHVTNKILFPKAENNASQLVDVPAYTGAFSVFDMFQFVQEDGSIDNSPYFVKSGTTRTATVQLRQEQDTINGNPFASTVDNTNDPFAGPIGGSLGGAAINHGHLVSVADDVARVIRSSRRCARYGSSIPTVSPYVVSATGGASDPIEVESTTTESDPPVSRAADGIAVLPIGVAPDNPGESISSAADRSVDAWEYTPPDRAMALEGADITLDPCYDRTLRGVQAVVAETGQTTPVIDEGTRHILDMSDSDTAETQVRTLGVGNKCSLQILSSAVSSPLLPVYPFKTPVTGAHSVKLGKRGMYGDIMNCVAEALWWTHQWANYEVVNGVRDDLTPAPQTSPASALPSNAYTSKFEAAAVEQQHMRLQRLWGLNPSTDKTHWFSPGIEVRPPDTSSSGPETQKESENRGYYGSARIRFFNRGPLPQNNDGPNSSGQSTYFDNTKVAYKNTEHQENEYSGFHVIQHSSTVWAPMSRTDASCGMLNGLDTALLIPPCTGKLVPYAVAFVDASILAVVRTQSEPIYNRYVPQGQASNAMFASVARAVFPSDVVRDEIRCVKLISNWSGIYQSGASQPIEDASTHDPTLYSSFPPMDSPEALRATLVHSILAEVSVLQCIVRHRFTHVFTDGATGDVFACTQDWHDSYVASRYCAWTSPYTADDTVCYAVSPCSFVLADEDEPDGAMEAHNGACERLFSRDLSTHPATVALASGAPSTVNAELYHPSDVGIPITLIPDAAKFSPVDPGERTDAETAGQIVFPFDISTDTHSYEFYNDMYAHPYPYTGCIVTEISGTSTDGNVWASALCFGFLPTLDALVNQKFTDGDDAARVLIGLRLRCVHQSEETETLTMFSTDPVGGVSDDAPLLQVTNIAFRGSTCLFQLRERSQLTATGTQYDPVTHLIMGTDDGVLLFDQMREDGVAVPSPDCTTLTCVSFGVPEGMFRTDDDTFGPPVVITASCPRFVSQPPKSWIQQHKVGVFMSSLAFLVVVVVGVIWSRRRVRRSNGLLAPLPPRNFPLGQQK